MTRRRAAASGALLLLLLLAVGVTVISAAPTRSQTFFRDKLLADTKTSAAIKDLLEDEGGFVDRAIVFRDVTGDDRDDAIVRVQSGGAAGAVAIYVFSTAAGREGSELKVVYRQQRLTRASTSVKGTTLSFRTSTYAVGDELCCPSKVVETALKWDSRKRAFTVTSRKDVVAPAAPTPTATPTPAA